LFLKELIEKVVAYYYVARSTSYNKTLILDQKYLEMFEMWCWRKIEKIRWSISVKEKKY